MLTNALRSPATLTALALSAGLALLAPAPAQASSPVITTFACPLDNGGGRFYCFIDYNSSTTAIVNWKTDDGDAFTDPGWSGPGRSDYFGHCQPGIYIRVTVTVTNASGSATQTSHRFRCNGGPIIL